MGHIWSTGDLNYYFSLLTVRKPELSDRLAYFCYLFIFYFETEPHFATLVWNSLYKPGMQRDLPTSTS